MTGTREGRDGVDVSDLIAQLRALVEGARSMPMSTSAVVNRSEVLDLITALEQAVPTAFADQVKVYSERDEVVAQAQEEAERVISGAESERSRLVGETDVFRLAKHRADAERVKAEAEAEALRRETDEYVDTRLATFEVTLTKTLEAVSRGRARLQGRSYFDALGEAAQSDVNTGVDDAGGGLTTPDELRTTGQDQRG